MVSPQVPDEALVTALSSAQIRVREKLDSIPGGIDKSTAWVFSCPDPPQIGTDFRTPRNPVDGSKK